MMIESVRGWRRYGIRRKTLLDAARTGAGGCASMDRANANPMPAPTTRVTSARPSAIDTHWDLIAFIACSLAAHGRVPLSWRAARWGLGRAGALWRHRI